MKHTNEQMVITLRVNYAGFFCTDKYKSNVTYHLWSAYVCGGVFNCRGSALCLYFILFNVFETFVDAAFGQWAWNGVEVRWRLGKKVCHQGLDRKRPASNRKHRQWWTQCQRNPNIAETSNGQSSFQKHPGMTFTHWRALKTRTGRKMGECCDWVVAIQMFHHSTH